MPELNFNQTINKRAFEAKLYEDFGRLDICSRKHQESGADDHGNLVINTMTLYYETDRGHVGTWMNGKGWIFASAYAS